MDNVVNDYIIHPIKCTFNYAISITDKGNGLIWQNYKDSLRITPSPAIQSLSIICATG